MKESVFILYVQYKHNGYIFSDIIGVYKDEEKVKFIMKQCFEEEYKNWIEEEKIEAENIQISKDIYNYSIFGDFDGGEYVEWEIFKRNIEN